MSDSFKTLQEARQHENSLVILTNYYQPYVVCAARRVRCSEECLAQLLNDLDVNFAGMDEESRLWLRADNIGDWVGDYMNEIDGIWINKKQCDAGYEQAIRDVIDGKRERLGYYGP